MERAGPKARGSRLARVVVAAVTAVVSGLLLVSCAHSPASTAPGGSAAGTSAAARPATTSRPRGVIALNAISTLRSLFNQADGHPRLVLIFSPT